MVKVGKPVRRRHEESFKQDAARLMANRQGRTIAQLAKELGVTSGQLHAWELKYRSDVRLPEAELVAEVERLRREVSQLREERDVLKKATAFFVRASR
jgi:transposase